MGIEEYTNMHNIVDDKFELITKLYDRLILNLKYIKKYIKINKKSGLLTQEEREKNSFIINKKIEKLNQSIDIIEYLKSSLNFEDEQLRSSSEYLYGLYDYQLLLVYKLMVNMEENSLDKVLNVFTEMRLAWIEQVEEIKNNG